MPLSLSLIVPVYNEAENLPVLFQEIRQALDRFSYEVILVDDGSTDGSAAVAERLARDNRSVTAVILTRNFGQTAALAAGFQEARNDILIPLDGDGQNDPRDIPSLIQKIEEGNDVVSGWRHPRQDPFFSRRCPSALANFFIARITGIHLHDFGCTLKAYRREALKDLRLYGEMHRFLPAWCASRGARIAEVVVHHRARRHGTSHYGMGRLFKVLLDLLTAQFITGYITKPSYFFGGAGFLLYLLAGLCTAVVFYDKLGPDRWPPLRIPLLLLASFLGIVATLLLMIGLLAELIVRVYYEISDRQPYRIKTILKAP